MRHILAVLASLLIAAPGLAQTADPDLGGIDRAWADTPWTELYDAQLDGRESATFSPPPESEIPDTEFGRLVRRGLAIFTDTPAQARGFAGDGLNCSNCHLDRGRRPGAAPMWSAWVSYPQFRTKNGAVNTFAMRVQGCFRFSMNGSRHPPKAKSSSRFKAMPFSWRAVPRPASSSKAEAGHFVQLFIPGNTFHTARVIGERRWFLGASTQWPGVEPQDVEPGDLEALAAKYPDVAVDLREFAMG